MAKLSGWQSLITCFVLMLAASACGAVQDTQQASSTEPTVNVISADGLTEVTQPTVFWFWSPD